MEADKITIIRVDNAAYFIGDLFKQAFGDPPPMTPIHYVAFYQVSPSMFEAIGYYHADHRGEYALAGGLCVDLRYRNRGIGEKLTRSVFADAGETKAFFTYSGNPVSRAIAYRVGYEDAKPQHMLVRWLKRLSEEEKEKLTTEVVALGPF